VEKERDTIFDTAFWSLMAVLFTGAVFTMGAVGTVPNGRVRKYDFLHTKKGPFLTYQNWSERFNVE